MGITDKAKDAMPDNLDEAKGKAGEVASGIKDKAVDVAGTIKDKTVDVAGTIKDKTQVVAQKLDDKAEALSQKDGVVGKVAGAAHTVLDKIDGDDAGKAQPATDTAERVSGATVDAADSADVSESEAVRETKDATGTAI